LFFLRKDAHPEPNSMVLKIFFLGMASAGVTIFLELGFFNILCSLNLPPFWEELISLVLGVALIEEVMKYLVVRKWVMKSPEMDEPYDVMLYMIISALGFAGLENLLYLFPFSHPFKFFDTLFVTSFRFLGAVFLHALCSGILGYYLALTFFHPQHKKKFIIEGLSFAVLLHIIFDFSIIKTEGIIIPIGIVIISSSFIFWAIKKLKKLKSICEII